jgi:hypothetical protein
MLQLKNNSPFAATMALFPNEQGIDTLYIIVKASFNIGKQWTLLDKQLPPVAEDVYWAEPAKSSIKAASDLHLGKLSTDIIFTGHACAPEGKQARQLDVSVAVGKVNKTIRVFGDREWQNGHITAPEPFQTMPLVYEKAFGGVHEKDGEVIAAELRNPVGVGFAGKRKNGEMNGVALPNLENPNQLIQTISDRPDPACFSFISPSWQPRVNYAGTYDDDWQKSRSPYLPDDFDKRFFNMAHPDLVYPGYMQGGEPVSISGMHPKGNLQFNIPQVRLAAKVNIKNRIESPVFNLETLILEPNQLQLSLVMRAAVCCDKAALKISEVTINLSR